MIKKPNFFIVGAPRSGTTAMYEYLKQHPEIFMSQLKEPQFFGSDLIRTPKAPFYRHDIKRYLALFAPAGNAKVVGEGSTLYLKSREAASEIKEFSPSAKVIIMLRNPVDLLYSLHSFALNYGSEVIEDFEGALDAETDRKKLLRVPDSCEIVDGLFYRERAKFKEPVERYFKVFGQGNVHVIVYDDLRNNTPKVYAETLQFLGVSTDFQPEFNVVHENRRIRSRALRYIWRRRSGGVHRVVFEYSPPWLSRRMVKTLKWVYSRPAPRTPINAELRRRLQGEFKGEIEQLSELLQRDLTHWVKE
jgi:hypothetical protein